MRVSRVKGIWAYYLPLDVTLSFSAIYEIIEWLIAIKTAPEAGLAFLGTQGDVWDAQKDMLMAGTGAFIAMIIVAIINLIYQKNFAKEMKESFTIPSGDEPLGEVRLSAMLKEK
jgi:putative membrane protein